MSKPRKKRVVRFDPAVTYFKPRGVPLSGLEEVVLVVEEVEALRLADFEDLDQVEAAKKMKVSQSTFNRVLASARRKTSEALVYGKAIKVEGGDYTMPIGSGGSGRDCFGRRSTRAGVGSSTYRWRRLDADHRRFLLASGRNAASEPQSYWIIRELCYQRFQN